MAKQYITDFNIHVSRENVQGANFLHRAFISGTFTSEQTVWNSNTIWVPPTSAATMTVVSTSANDISAGTGARTVSIAGLDANYLEISETITMNGLTPVTTTKSYLRISRMTVASAGSTQSNAGVISISNTSLQGSIVAGAGQSSFSIYTVPANKVAYMHSLHLSSSKSTDGKFMLRTCINGVSRIRHSALLTGGFYSVEFKYPTVIPAGTDIELRAVANTGNGTVAGAYDLFLVDKPITTMGGTGIPDVVTFPL
jgi:hypothetical protein